MNKNVVIIGGGLGGLFSGAILSKEGLRVTILEKNSTIGGGLQSFRRFGELFDTGMHIIGGMQKDGNVRRICEYLGIWDRVHIMDTDPNNIDSIYYSEDKTTYHIAKGRTNFIKSLSTAFPAQRDNLIAYVDALYKVANEVDLFYLRPSSDYMQVYSEDFHMSATAFIDKYISDPYLQSVVAYLNPLYGGRYNTTPAYIHALISVLYIDGSSRFVGGSLCFAETLRDFIIEHGGTVLAGDGVKSVHNEGRVISGVTTEKGKNYSADYYICAIHPCSFFSLLDDETILPKPYRNRLNNLPNSYSAFTLNIKFKPNTFKYFNYTMYYMSRYDEIWSFGEIDKWPRGFLFITPPEIEQGEFANKMIITAPMSWEAVKCWSDTTKTTRSKEYEAWKDKCANNLLDCLEEIYPNIRNCVESINTASPLTIRDFYGVKEGSMYGFSKDCNNLLLSQVPVVTKVPNLFLTGQNCNLHGFCGVALTAILTAEAILGRNFVLNKINKYDDIRPYYNYEIHSAMQRVANSPLLDSVTSFLHPGMDVKLMREKIENITTINEFQQQVMYPAASKIINNTCNEFSYDGIQNISPDETYLFVSNHRDIMLDATLLSYILVSHGFDSPEITFGANLMQGEFVIDVGKSNKMFRVERPGNKIREFYEALEHLSGYIRYTLTQKHQSIWIAQRNGRTKNGEDRTDQGIIKMFAISGQQGSVRAIADLKIIPVAISYEWEPCDLLKAIELFKAAAGPYHKKPGEDLNSIITGVIQPKGNVHISICPEITEQDLRPFESLTNNNFCKRVASLIDSRICAAYKLFPNNYIAYDILHGGDKFIDNYSKEQKEQFEAHLADLLNKATDFDYQGILNLLLGIYANPIESRQLFDR